MQSGESVRPRSETVEHFVHDPVAADGDEGIVGGDVVRTREIGGIRRGRRRTGVYDARRVRIGTAEAESDY